MSETMRVLIVEPNKTPYISDIGTDLKSLQAAIGGGYIEIVPLDNERTVLVCDEEGKIKRLEGNRRIGKSIIAGTFFICSTSMGEDGEDLVSLSERKQVQYMERFKEPEGISQEEVQKDAGITIISW